ncbi:hypothetical protein HMPREF1605_02070, partial [Escherichia coli 908521]
YKKCTSDDLSLGGDTDRLPEFVIEEKRRAALRVNFTHRKPVFTEADNGGMPQRISHLQLMAEIIPYKVVVVVPAVAQQQSIIESN